MSASWDRYQRAIEQVTAANGAQRRAADEAERERALLGADVDTKYRAAVNKIATFRSNISGIAADARGLANSTGLSCQIRPIEVSRDVEAAIRDATCALQVAKDESALLAGYARSEHRAMARQAEVKRPPQPAAAPPPPEVVQAPPPLAPKGSNAGLIIAVLTVLIVLVVVLIIVL
ncbi:MAG: hypothetical protein WBZ04_07445 [Candidatus Nanopelagicales bacterium]